MIFMFQIFSTPEEEDELFRSFDFMTPHTMLLAQFRGDISVIDVRTPG